MDNVQTGAPEEPGMKLSNQETNEGREDGSAVKETTKEEATNDPDGTLSWQENEGGKDGSAVKGLTNEGTVNKSDMKLSSQEATNEDAEDRSGVKGTTNEGDVNEAHVKLSSQEATNEGGEDAVKETIKKDDANEIPLQVLLVPEFLDTAQNVEKVIDPMVSNRLHMSTEEHEVSQQSKDIPKLSENTKYPIHGYNLKSSAKTTHVKPGDIPKTAVKTPQPKQGNFPKASGNIAQAKLKNVPKPLTKPNPPKQGDILKASAINIHSKESKFPRPSDITTKPKKGDLTEPSDDTNQSKKDDIPRSSENAIQSQEDEIKPSKGALPKSSEEETHLFASLLHLAEETVSLDEDMVKVIRSKSDFQVVLKEAGEKLVAVDFSAPWCGPCRSIRPWFHSLSLKHEDVVFLEVDVDDCEELTKDCAVFRLPTFQFYKKEKKVAEFSGALEEKLESTISELK